MNPLANTNLGITMEYGNENEVLFDFTLGKLLCRGGAVIQLLLAIHDEMGG